MFIYQLGSYKIKKTSSEQKNNMLCHDVRQIVCHKYTKTLIIIVWTKCEICLAEWYAALWSYMNRHARRSVRNVLEIRI